MRNVYLLLFALLLTRPGGIAAAPAVDSGVEVPILAYHRFGASAADAMTVKTSVFASHLAYLRANGYTVIPLRRLVAYIAGNAPPPPERSVVITADDGHASVYTDMFPLIARYRIPVTLFIYPSAISNADYAMTWAQLREMRESGLVDVESHTYWHPNFKVEKKRLSPSDYETFVRLQMSRSKEVLEQRLGGRVDMLAWPFGIYDVDLIKGATQAGYVAAFTIERRHARRSDNVMALPRYLMTNPMQGRLFEQLLASPSPRMRGWFPAGAGREKN